MNFDLVDTPTLQAVATADEQALIQDLEKRVEEAFGQADSQPEVVEAAGLNQTAEAHLAELHAAARTLNQHAKALNEEIAAATEGALDALIQSAAQGKPDFGKSRDVAALEQKNRLASSALERLVEHLTPLAQIGQLRAKAHALATRGRALERIAHERAEKVLSRMREAVSEEMVLPVDMSKGVAGAVLSRAGQIKRRAIEISVNADRLEQWYMDKNRKER
ncbi:MAG TPA: hypothetical protein VN841_02180 [Bryobacteraceae bacterium]|nr:hypothetical protein [Bryobacteraceae bacterium]